MNKVKHFHGGSWVDISDYILSGVDKILRADMFILQVAASDYVLPAIQTLNNGNIKVGSES